ncbi:MerR family transcriptional regulator [Geodermatophilus sp. SYSU D01176]
MRSLQSGLRTVDVARRAGCSVQLVRDLEREGVLPPVARTPSGYRSWTEVHVQAALAYRALAAGAGPVEARRLVRAAHAGPPSELLARLDAAHARLHTERRDVALAQEAAAAIAAEPIEDPLPSDAMGISELAGALGVRTSTLRHWDAEGLVVPSRSPGGRARSYAPGDVRDARIVSQLRRAGYRIEPLRALLPELRRARRGEEVAAALAARDAGITARSRALLRGAALLDALVGAPAPAGTGAGAR